MAPFALAEPCEPMLRANSRAVAVAGSPRGARDHREDGEGLGPGDLRKGEGEGPGGGAVRAGRRGRGGRPGPRLRVCCGLRACGIVTVSPPSSLNGQPGECPQRNGK